MIWQLFFNLCAFIKKIETNDTIYPLFPRIIRERTLLSSSLFEIAHNENTNVLYCDRQEPVSQVTATETPSDA